MITLFQTLLPWFVILSHIIFVFLIAAFISRKTWGREIINKIRKDYLALGFVVSLAAVLGSLFYSSIVGFPPCDLCWWQRVFLFPQFVIFAVALKKKDKNVYRYSLVLSFISILISLYNIYVQTTGNSLIPCSAVESCTKVYVMAFNYVTIPSMALTIGAYLILLGLIARNNE